MAKFRLTRTFTTIEDIEINAKSEKEAIKLAYGDGDYITVISVIDGGFRVKNKTVKEVKAGEA